MSLDKHGIQLRPFHLMMLVLLYNTMKRKVLSSGTTWAPLHHVHNIVKKFPFCIAERYEKKSLVLLEEILYH